MTKRRFKKLVLAMGKYSSLLARRDGLFLASRGVVGRFGSPISRERQAEAKAKYEKANKKIERLAKIIHLEFFEEGLYEQAKKIFANKVN